MYKLATFNVDALDNEFKLFMIVVDVACKFEILFVKLLNLISV